MINSLSSEKIQAFLSEDKFEDALKELDKIPQITLDHLLLKFDITKKLPKNKTNKTKLANASLAIAHHYHFELNEFNKEGEHAIFAKKIFTVIGDQIGLARSLYYEGLCNFYSGKLEEAEELFNDCIAMFKASENPIQAGGPIQALGQLLLERGELDKALSIFNEGLTALQSQLDQPVEIPNMLHGTIAFNLSFISLIYRAKLDYEKAVSTTKLAMEHLQKETQQLPVFYYGHCFFSHFLILLDLKQIEQATGFLAQIKLQLGEMGTTKLIVQGFNLCDALLLHQSQNLKSKFKAMEIFEKLIKEEVIYKTFQLLAIKSMCEILFDELKLYNNPETLSQINVLIDQLIDFSLNTNSISQYVEATILKAKISLIEGNLDKANELLSKSKEITQEKNLLKLTQIVENEEKTIRDSFLNWERLISQNSTLSERIQHANIDDYIKIAKKMVF